MSYKLLTLFFSFALTYSTSWGQRPVGGGGTLFIPTISAVKTNKIINKWDRETKNLYNELNSRMNYCKIKEKGFYFNIESIDDVEKSLSFARLFDFLKKSKNNESTCISLDEQKYQGTLDCLLSGKVRHQIVEFIESEEANIWMSLKLHKTDEERKSIIKNLKELTTSPE